MAEPDWLTNVKRLHAIAHSGLAFCQDPFDEERYQEIALIAKQMMAELADCQVERIQELVIPSHKRYVTPQIEVRGAVIHDNKILLVKEKQDGKWTLPGGYADVGLSARQNVEKEIAEEAGLTVNAQRLYSLRHKALGEYPPDIREFYKLFFLCHAESPESASAGMETSEVGFFEPDKLPELSTGRVIPRDIDNAFTAHRNPDVMPEFD